MADATLWQLLSARTTLGEIDVDELGDGRDDFEDCLETLNQLYRNRLEALRQTVEDQLAGAA
jgi:hypothetical protein